LHRQRRHGRGRPELDRRATARLGHPPELRFVGLGVRVAWGGQWLGAEVVGLIADGARVPLGVLAFSRIWVSESPSTRREARRGSSRSAENSFTTPSA
jgi:hypothetical protein